MVVTVLAVAKMVEVVKLVAVAKMVAAAAVTVMAVTIAFGSKALIKVYNGFFNTDLKMRKIKTLVN